MTRHVQALVAEIGSTTTLVNAFNDLDTSPCFLGQGMAETSVLKEMTTKGIAGASQRLVAASNPRTAFD